MENIQVFNRLAADYDNWFEMNDFAYQSEILAVQQFIPRTANGLEIGAGILSVIKSFKFRSASGPRLPGSYKRPFREAAIYKLLSGLHES
ncbi:MAG: hypothetical protein HY730_10395 [Candidatus Tectomicrobia bacterium]|uniref:Uncharacterized protein n=1 Tax=Tectimicrobiota bacterium TaxID=2528274 RepID=A0A933LRW9_UNCTE|nr:hypothetical protein [Candidatus Tectomicrobia bacterium]